MYNLSETVELMNSKDYKERLQAEYWQAMIRFNNIHFLLIKYEAGMDTIEPASMVELLQKQARIMDEYLDILKDRATMLGIELKY